MTNDIRCPVCGHMLFRQLSDLPMEIESTGASLMGACVEIKCNHCKYIHVFNLGIEKVHEAAFFRVDM